jgi:hypothetical protein
MSRELQAIGEEYRKDSNDSFVSVVRSAGEINKSLLGIASEMTEHSKRSVGRAFEMQAQLAKKSYHYAEDWKSETPQVQLQVGQIRSRDFYWFAAMFFF